MDGLVEAGFSRWMKDAAAFHSTTKLQPRMTLVGRG
jgi:hypothetical protein